ncbi:MAG: hypothetical protein N3B12_05480, partial [Armatimonadetes bacterium]|nr:hypothetical protein [Armatimonadota bacterium]
MAKIDVDENVVKTLRSIGALKEAAIQESVGEEVSRCGMCQWHCRIQKGGVGHCRTVINYQGLLYTTIYGVISSAAADPIEKKPVFHYKPGSLCFSVGTLGCNFRCVFCQNWQIAYADAIDYASLPKGPGERSCNTNVNPQMLVELARKYQCQGVAWTYNEPAI